MKFKNILLVSLLILGMLACTNKDDPSLTSKDGLDGFLTLTINSGSLKSSTRTTTRTEPHSPGTEPGEGAEIKINNLTVLLTDYTGTIKQVVPIPNASGIESSYTTDPFKVTPGEYWVFALVNSHIQITKNQSVDQVIKAASAEEITSGFRKGSFFMTNAQIKGIEGVAIAAGILVRIEANKTSTAQVNVDRFAARIDNVTETPDITKLKDIFNKADPNFMDEIEVVGFIPMNLNSKMYLIQSFAHENPTTPERQVYLQTPPVANLNSYLLPPTTYKKVNNEGIGVANLTKKEDFVKKVYVSENRPDFIPKADGTYTAQRMRTTAVIFRVDVKKEKNAVPTFYTYNGRIYFDYTKLQAVVADTNFDLTGVEESDVEAIRAKGILVYEKGVMYYTFFIINDSKDANGDYIYNYLYFDKPYYSVFRNSIYKLKIASISNLGDDVPEGDKDPTTVIDPDEINIFVDVAVENWVLKEIEVEL